MVLVTGATGHLGKTVIDQLLKKTSAGNIAVFVRDEAKGASLKDKGIDVRVGSYDDTGSIERAMKGVSKVLLISGRDHNRLQQHKNFVDAARNAGVKHIVYTGVSMRDVSTSTMGPFMENHFLTEDYIRESGLTYSFLRNTLYMEVVQVLAGEKVLDTGIYLPAGDGRLPFALRRELGEAAANLLLEPGHENKTYELTGDQLYSFQDIATALSGLSGKAVNYTNADAETFPDQLRKFGVPEYGVSLVSGFAGDIKIGQYEVLSNDLEALLGRKPASLNEGLKEVFGF